MINATLVLSDGDSCKYTGGCLACIGRYEEEKESIRRFVESGDVKRSITEIVIALEPLYNYSKVKDSGKFSRVFHELANNSAWSDGFLTKEWDPSVEHIAFDPINYSAQYTINCIGAMRRVIDMWVDYLDFYLDQGMSFNGALMLSIIRDNFTRDYQCLSDAGNDEQVISMFLWDKATLVDFVNNTLEPEGKTTDKSYSDTYGYPQKVVDQWMFDCVNASNYWHKGFDFGQPHKVECTLSPNGSFYDCDNDVTDNVMRGRDPLVLSGVEGTISGLFLGLKEGSRPYEWVEGRFSKYLVRKNLDEDLIEGVQNFKEFING